jgi:hypothetical protein
MKTKHLLLKPLVVILAAIVLLSGCTSYTMIRSVPDGATVYVDEELKGVTPYRHSDSKIIGSTTEIRLEKEGFDTYYTQLVRLEEADGGAIIGAFFFLPAILWAAKYKPSHTYYLVPLGENLDKGTSNETSPNFQKLKELKAMLDSGMITQEEYDREKAKILNK